MAGLVGPLLEAANRVTSVSMVMRDRTLARMEFAPAPTPLASPIGFVCW